MESSMEESIPQINKDDPNIRYLDIGEQKWRRHLTLQVGPYLMLCPSVQQSLMLLKTLVAL